MPQLLLILNAGSSSLKFTLFELQAGPEIVLRGQIDGLMTQPTFIARDALGNIRDEHCWEPGTTLPHAAAIEFLFDRLRAETIAGRPLVAAGHRIVHGGTRFTQPVRVDGDVLAELQKLVPLAPLHQPHNLAAIHAVSRLLPDLPQVACFDTAFHRTQPTVAQMFALPRRFADEGVRRYGFHGLSYEYIASVLPKFTRHGATGRTVIAHLGNGVSLCALRDGHSVATTMGLTPLDGVPMGTRCGSLDPGVLLYLMDQHQMDSRRLARLLYHESGLLAVSGVSSDMRGLLASDDPRAAEAVELFVYRIQREIGSLAAALEGLETLVFTGGIGENSPVIRERVCRGAAWLGVELDESANRAGGPCISSPDSRVSVWVIPTNEELMIARHTLGVLNLSPESNNG